jgi:two-component system sensor histidine kinase YesM
MQVKTNKLLKKIGGSIRQKLMDMSISTKIMVFYFVLLIFSIVVSSVLYQKIFLNIISNKVSDVAIQMLHSIKTNIDTMIDTVNDYSKMIITDEDVQTALRQASEHTNVSLQRRATLAITRLRGNNSYISSIYIFDRYGNKYAADKSIIKILKINSIREAEWYPEVIARKGGFVLVLNAGGIFEMEGSREKFISLARVINDVNSQTMLGVLVINISEDMFKKAYKGIAANYGTEVIILDNRKRNIVQAEKNTGFDIKKFLDGSGERDSNSAIWKSGGQEYMVSYLKVKEYGWKLLSIIPFRELSKESNIFSLVAFTIIIVNSFLLFIGSISISRLITVPIKKLLNSMKGIEEGEFRKIEIMTGNDEIGKLRDGYNTMIQQIQNLIARVVEEQRIKRKTELDILQAQIKPHFLYNTFDAISSLALAGRNQDVYTIMKALGTYYRTSLSRGREVITVGEEIDVVANYLKIQKFRYGDMFTLACEVDRRIVNNQILKLVLQPFAENALYHGIKPKGENGIIKIEAKQQGDFILLCIADDGVGMSREKIKNILSSQTENETSGFGIRGTIERLRLFYGIENIVQIESEKGCGTRVTIRIPMIEGGAANG